MSDAKKQRAFREKHKPEGPPYVGIMLDEISAKALAEGYVTIRVQAQAMAAVKEFWPDAEKRKTA
jgi:hypothetical protein